MANWVRRRSVLAVVIGCAASCPAQSAASHTWDVMGRLRSESGRGIEGANLTYLPDHSHGLEWLASIDGPSTPVIGVSGADGRFRLMTSTPTGSLVVEHADGLGAVVPRIAAEAPLSIELMPLGEVSRSDGAPLVAHLHWLGPDGRMVTLGHRTGRTIRLPAGRIALLVEDGERLVEIRTDVQSGRSTRLRIVTGDGPKLQSTPGLTWRLDRWLEFGEIRRAGRLPLLTAPDRLLGSVDDGVGNRFIDAWSSVMDADVAPPPGTWRKVRIREAERDLGIARARLITVRSTPGGVRVMAQSSSDADGRAFAFVPERVDESSCKVVILAPDGAVASVASRDLHNDARDCVVIPIARSTQRRIRVVDADSAAIPDVRIVVIHPTEPLLDRVIRSDGRGFARLDADAGEPLELRIDSGRHVPQRAVLAPAAPDGAVPTFVLNPGLSMFGRVLLEQSRAAAKVDVELRDPSGGGELAARYTTTDHRGEFRFEGLPDGSYTLFATARLSGVTWSGRIQRAQPGADQWTILLRNEDPEPPGVHR